MTHPVILDASVLIAAMQPADVHHQATRDLIRAAARTRVLQAHAMSIAEAGVGAARSGHLSMLQEAFERLRIVFTPRDDDEPWRLARLRADTGLPLTDCCVLDAAKQAEGLLATFDQRLASAALARGVRVSTSEAMR